MRSLACIVVLAALLAFWMIWVPAASWGQLPLAFREWLHDGGTAGLLLLFVVVPLTLAFLATIAVVMWLRFSSWIVPRREIERWLAASIYGGHQGKFQKWLLDRFYLQD